jgi:ABC-type transporter Mla subunit MlaD
MMWRGNQQPSFLRELLPWAIAAGFALVAAWAGVNYKSEQSAAVQLRREHALADVALQGARQQLEAERIVTRRQLQTLDQQVNEANTRLTQARTELERATAKLAAATNQTGDRSRQFAEVERQLGIARASVGDRERQLADHERQAVRLKQRIEALTAASADLTRQLESAQARIAQLTDEMKLQRELADSKITVLASRAKDNPQALAVVVWDPMKKEGMLQVEKLPSLRANQDYQLWVVDPQYPDPVDGGVFNTDPQSSGARFAFKPKRPIRAMSAFAISRERKGGVAKAEGPIVVHGK